MKKFISIALIVCTFLVWNLSIIGSAADEIIYTANAKQISDFAPLPAATASAQYINGVAVIKESNSSTYGMAMSDYFDIDLDRTSTVVLDVASVSSKYAVQLNILGDEWGDYMLASSTQTGIVTINIKSGLSTYKPTKTYAGKKRARLFILPFDAQDASISLRNITVKYPQASSIPVWGGDMNLSDLLSWDVNYGAKIENVSNGYWVGLSRTDGAFYGTRGTNQVISVDYDKNPYMEITIANNTATSGAYFQLDAGSGTMYFAANITTNGTFKLPLKNIHAVGLKGIKDTKLYFGIEGNNQDIKYEVTSIKMGYDPSPDWDGNVDLSTLLNWDINYGAKIENTGGYYVKLNRNDGAYYGTIGTTKGYLIDFDKDPYMEITIANNTANYGAYFQLDVGGGTKYFADWKTTNGTFKLPLKSMQATDITGRNLTKLYFGLNGSSQNISYEIVSMRLGYNAPVAFGGNINLSDLVNWDKTNNAGVSNVNESYILAPLNGAGYGSTYSIIDYITDYDKKPYINIELANNTSSGIYLQLKVAGESNPRYFASGITNNGVISIPLKSIQATDLTGIKNTTFYLGIVGAGTSCEIKSISLTYQEMPFVAWDLKIDPANLMNWENSGNIQVANENGKYVFKEVRLDSYYYGTINSNDFYKVDFEKNPYIEFEIAESTSDRGAYLQIKQENGSVMYIAQMLGNGVHKIPLKTWQAAAVTGVNLIKVYFGIDSTIDNASFVIKNIKFTYPKQILAENLTIKDANDNEMTDITSCAGKTITVTIAKSPQFLYNTLLVTTLTDSNNLIKDIKLNKVDASVNNNGIMSVNIDVPSIITGEKLKIFVWNTESATPLINSMIIR